jgi:hypothetical protein
VQTQKRRRFQNVERTGNELCLLVDVQACTHRCIYRVKTSRIGHQASLYFFLSFFFLSVRQPPVGQGLLIHEISRHTHNDAPQSVWLLCEWSPHHRDLYWTTHNNHNWQTSISPVRFELTISAGEQPQTYALTARALGPTPGVYWREHILCCM